MRKCRKVVLVGHCVPDAHMLRNVISRAAPGVEVAAAYDGQSLDAHISDESLLLINRVLDGAFFVPEGIELIKLLKRNPNPPPMMLVSNFSDAQQHAVAAGAMPGFGKSQLYNDATTALLRQAIMLNGHNNHC